MESYLTIQGEGYHQGKSAFFIRTQGCDVGCVWCDVKASWPMENNTREVEELVGEAKLSGAEIVVITGGEPLMHDLSKLTNALQENGLRTHIETSGAYALSGAWDWICLSPKKFKKPLPEIIPLANELKVVTYNKSDFDWAEEYAKQVTSSCKLFLQPEWSRRNDMSKLIVEYVHANPRWSVSLQVHKYLGLP